MIVSINAEKACAKVQHAFLPKTLSKVGTEGTHHDTTKELIKNPMLASY